MTEEDKKFPKDFLWGTATSSYQIEGNNFNSDWWKWEEEGKTKEKSGKACDYWNKYQKYHDYLSELGVKSFRLSLEWSRIEPREGEFSQDSVRHYREILEDLKKRNIKVILTLWHWTSPIWFSEKYGFHKKESVEIFKKYVEFSVKKLGDLVDVYVVLNEPMVPLGMGYLTGKFPPGYKNIFKFWKALSNLAEAYRESYRAIHAIKKDSVVGISYLYNWYDAEGLGFLLKIADGISRLFRITAFGNKIKGCEDYFGVDYYRIGKIKFDPKNSMYLGFRIEEDENNVMKWVSYPEGIYKTLKEAWKRTKLPIYIMENGMPDDLKLDDPERVKFLRAHLFQVQKAISEGVDVKGYNYWSLMDNYEWGTFHFRFGLLQMDYDKIEATPRRSFYEYQKIIKQNSL